MLGHNVFVSLCTPGDSMLSLAIIINIERSLLGSSLSSLHLSSIRHIILDLFFFFFYCIRCSSLDINFIRVFCRLVCLITMIRSIKRLQRFSCYYYDDFFGPFFRSTSLYLVNVASFSYRRRWEIYEVDDFEANIQYWYPHQIGHHKISRGMVKKITQRWVRDGDSD